MKRSHDLRCIIKPLLVVVLFCMPLRAANAASDLYIKDTPADTGIEPNPDPGPMWVSEDIWVRQNPIAGYSPLPFGADPAWLTAVSPLHQNPEYRPPQYSKLNYVYVRVRNRGTTSSAGTERLRVYWAKASTGLGWPSQWVDYVAAFCGPDKLYGMEITKPRRNLADPTVPAAEIQYYTNAIKAIGTLPSFVFPGSVQYWHKQQEEHSHVVNFGGFAHVSDGFLPWHREFLSRYEVLLREAYPLTTLFYWDWTTDPRTSAQIVATMGSFSGPIGAPFDVLAPPSVSRFTGTSPSAPTPTATSDSTVTGSSSFSGHRTANENPHNRSHNFSGGSGGNMTSPGTSAQDPFFFLLHGNADRLWAMWQRKNATRYDAATAYTGTSSDMTVAMSPWNGLEVNGNSATASNPTLGMRPWTAADGYITKKAANHASVVFPPIYDTSPLTIPSLAPGESVVIEIPWYPPNPADFACFGSDQGHACLLARIETSPIAPYGMTTAETTDVNSNTRNNNNIAWKNITVQDMWPGALMAAPIWLHNIFNEKILTQLRFRIPTNVLQAVNFGTLLLDLRPELYQRWVDNGTKGQGFERVQGNQLQLIGTEATLTGIPLEADEVQEIDVILRLDNKYQHPAGRVVKLDLEQRGAPGDPDFLIGGNRFEFDFNKLRLVESESTWRYLDTGVYPGEGWTTATFDDSKWHSGRAEFGYGDGDESTTIESGALGKHYISTWFRKTFTVPDPGLYRNLWLSLKADDGAVLYLNGTEIVRHNLPGGSPITADTKASEDVNGVSESTYYPFDVSRYLSLLRAGENLLAVEVHQSASESEDLSFDLELAANLGTSNFPPRIVFVTPTDGNLFLMSATLPLATDALAPDGKIREVQFFADGNPVGAVSKAPFSIDWQGASLGRHQIEARAVDELGLSSSAFVTIGVLSNVPPSILITDPVSGMMVDPNKPLTISVIAKDVGGSVARVEFFAQSMEGIFGDDVPLGASATPPFSITVTNIPTGHQMIFAVATDDEGESTVSEAVPIHLEADVRPVLKLVQQNGALTVSWEPSAALLEETDVLGPQANWKEVANAKSPYPVAPQSKAKFYRAVLH